MTNTCRTSTLSVKFSWMYAHIYISLLEGLTNVVQKNKGVKTVVNKLNTIDTKFRFFKMELLAGEPNYVVEHVSFSTVPIAFAPLTSNLP